MQNLGAVCHTLWAHVEDVKRSAKKTILRVQPFKVTQGRWNRNDRLATYDFLLVIHSMHGPISYCFRHYSDFCR